DAGAARAADREGLLPGVPAGPQRGRGARLARGPGVDRGAELQRLALQLVAAADQVVEEALTLPGPGEDTRVGIDDGTHLGEVVVVAEVAGELVGPVRARRVLPDQGPLVPEVLRPLAPVVPALVVLGVGLDLVE